MTELNTHRAYGKEYFDYLKYSEKGQLIKEHLLELLKWGSKTLHINLLNGKGKSALDVGCAFGYAVEILSSLGYDALGVDISVYGISQTTRNMGKNDFVVCDVQKNLPFTQKFDLITCFEVLEHLENPLVALQHMYDNSNSIILCTTPNKTIESIFKRMVKNFDKTHINAKTPREWEHQIRNTLKWDFIRIESFLSMNFEIAHKPFFKSFRLPFGMDTRILIKK